MARDATFNQKADTATTQTPVRRFVLATHGSLGDLHPFIALGQALVARGCGVVLASHPDYRAKVEAAGLHFVDYGACREDYVQDLRLKPEEIIRRLSGDHSFMIKRLIAPYLEKSIQDIQAVVAQADEVIGSSFAYGADIAARLAGKPFTSVALQPTVMMSAWDPPQVKKAPFILHPKTAAARVWNRAMMSIGETFMAASQNRVREIYHRHGLEPHIGLGGIVSEYRTLALYSPEFATPQPDFPPNTHIVGFPFFDSESGQETALAPELEGFLTSGPPPVVFSLGTAVVYGGERFFRRAIATAKRLKMRCVVLAGPESPLLNDYFGEQVFVAAYAPHSLLFPRASIVVHHGGVGSTAQALASGRPQLVTPVFGDQFDNARRLVELGLAKVLPYTNWRVSSAVSRLRSLLRDTRFAERAARCRPLIVNEDGAQAAAELLTR